MELNRNMFLFLAEREQTDLKKLIPEFKQKFRLSETEANLAISKYCCISLKPQRAGE